MNLLDGTLGLCDNIVNEILYKTKLAFLSNFTQPVQSKRVSKCKDTQIGICSITSFRRGVIQSPQRGQTVWKV